MNTFNQTIPISFANVTLVIKRDDLIHSIVSGNKFRKLKYNLRQAKSENLRTLLTFGGAYSNHIAAVAFAGKEHGFKTVGIIRGNELQNGFAQNPTLQFAHDCGMQFDFVSRDDYRKKLEVDFIEKLTSKWGRFYAIPEGGTNALAVLGCQEILQEEDSKFDFVCCCVGTGGTISGLINSAQPHQKIIGFPVLKGDFLTEEICKFATNDRWELIGDYNFGGYAKISNELVDFINRFLLETGIPLDPIYTGKMVFGVLDLIRKDYFPKDSKILVVHTGGLQGNDGMNIKLQKQNLPILLKNG